MDPVVKLFSDEIKHESYVRSLTDDFSVVDLVENSTYPTQLDNDDE